MRISTIMSEDHVWGKCLLQLFENRFYLGTYKWHKTVGESLQQWSPESGKAHEQGSRTSRFSLPDSTGTEHHPVKHTTWILLGQTQNSAPTTNFDIVGMIAQTQDR